MSKREGFLNIAEAPFLRILIPFILGIYIQTEASNPYPFIISIVISATLLIRYYTARSMSQKFSRSKLFGYAIFLIIFALGGLNSLLNSSILNIEPNRDCQTLIAKVVEQPKEKDNSIECISAILSDNNSNTTYNPKVILYFDKSNSASELNIGDIFIFKSNLREISNSKNPLPFNYVALMQRKGVKYTQYLTDRDWSVIDHKEESSIFSYGENIRTKIIDKIDGLNIDATSKSLLKPLLTGYTADIDNSQRKAFSTSGLSHILAVSGLHVGIVASIIFFLLTPLKYIRCRVFIPIFAIIGIWCFVIITGSHASSTRAAIMATSILIGEIFKKRGTTINSIMGAALFMLIYNPNYIFDVGFQLSFTAVFAIFYLYPIFIDILPKSNKVVRFFSSIAAITISAQIGTLPLSLLYFNQLPLMGIIANLVIVPLLPIIVAVAITSLILPLNIVVETLNYLLNICNYIANFISNIPHSSIDNIAFPIHFVLAAYIAIYLLFWGVKSKRSELILWLLAIVIAVIIWDVYTYKRHTVKSATIVYSHNKLTAINIIDGGENFVVVPDTFGLNDKVNLIAGEYWRANYIDTPQYITPPLKRDNLMIDCNFIIHNDETILILNSKVFNDKTTSQPPLNINKAIVCGNYKGHLSNLKGVFDIDLVIISANVNYFKRKSLIDECLRGDIPYYDIKECGAYIKETPKN